MSSKLVNFAAICSIIILNSCAGVDSFKESASVKSGIEAKVASHILFGAQCMSRPSAVITILNGPEHGTLSIRQITLSTNAGGQNCTGTGTAIFYTSAAGYKGPDSFRYNRKEFSLTQDYRLDVNVE